MPHINYPTAISESSEELGELEKHHRYSHLFQRVRMLRLLKSRRANHLQEEITQNIDRIDRTARKDVFTAVLRGRYYSSTPPADTALSTALN